MLKLSTRLLRCMSFAVVAALVALPALAQQGILAGDITQVELGIGKGQLIRLENPANTVYLADPAIADVQVMSPQLIYLFGRQPGETNLYAVGPGNIVVADMDIVVGIGVASINRNLQTQSPESTLEVRSAGRTVVIQGESESAEDIADAEQLALGLLPPDGTGRVVNQASVTGSQQVNLHVRFAEVERSSVQNIGINWDAVASTGNFVFDFATGTTGNGTNTLLGRYGSRNFSIDMLIDALAAENLVRILAEPNLTALSGETASFLAGGQFPLATVDNNGAVRIQYQTFGVSLAFTPTVLNDGRISLHVRPEVSELSNTGSVLLAGTSIPALNIRRAETTVELGSGQSFMIAGMYRSSERQSEDLTPFLSELPVLGPLFKRRNFDNEETELVIVVTPYLVQPVSAERIALPTDRLVAPVDQVPDAQLAGPGSNAVLAGSPIAGAVGSAGFILK